MKYHNPFLYKSQAKVTSVEPAHPFLLIEFEDTIFYPGGGGQPHDTGTLHKEGFSADVTEVYKDKGRIVHKALPKAGSIIAGDVVEQELDQERREQLIRMHTGEHMLFAALQKLFLDIALDKIQLDVSESSLFVISKSLTWEQLFAAEKQVNSVINEARSIIIKEITKEEAAGCKDLRVKLDRIREETIRVVEIDGFDLAACTGIHAVQTGFVGNLLITKLNLVKGSYEIRFKVNVRDEFFDYARSARQAASLLKSDQEALPLVLAKLLKENEDLKQRLRNFEKEKVNEVNTETIGSITFIHNSFAGIDKKQLVDRAASLLAPRTIVCFFNLHDDKCDIILMSAPDLGFVVPDFLKKILDPLNGRGGGRANFAMGSISASDAAKALQMLRGQVLALQV